jgi:hypothetical protein
LGVPQLDIVPADNITAAGELTTSARPTIAALQTDLSEVRIGAGNMSACGTFSPSWALGHSGSK